MMKKLAIVFAAGAAALIAGSNANAADNAVKSRHSTDVARTSTDISSRQRHHHGRHHHHHRGHRHWGHHHYQPYYNSYGYYAPRRYGYYGPRYYGGGPGITFSFGSGGWY